MAFGVNETGFELKRLLDILNDLAAQLSTVQDQATGEFLTVDLADENDPLVQIVNSVADQISVCWEQLQVTYNQFDPLKATGAALSGLVQLNGIRRIPGSPSTVYLTLTGTPNTFIPEGSQVTDMSNGPVFALPATFLDGAGNGAALAVCTADGPTVALAGTLVKILTPVSGWSTVINAADATPGVLEETDTQLRARQRYSTEVTGRSMIEDIYGNLINIAGVTYCRVFQNNTLVIDVRGIPGKAIAPVIVGGLDATIAETLHNQIPAGAETYGSTTVNVVDSLGTVYPIKFSRPAPINVYVAVAVTVVDSNLWPSDGDDQIKQAIVDFVQGGASTLGIDTGFDQDGIPPGVNVYASDLYLPISKVLGAKVTSVLVDIVDPPVTDEVVVAWNQVAAFATGRISVVVS